MLLHDKHKGLIKVWVEVCILNGSFLLLPNPFTCTEYLSYVWTKPFVISFRIKKFNFDIGVRGPSYVHLLQLLALQDSHSELKE